MVYCGVDWCGVVYVVVLCGSLHCIVVWCGVEWCGVDWCGVCILMWCVCIGIQILSILSFFIDTKVVHSKLVLQLFNPSWTHHTQPTTAAMRILTKICCRYPSHSWIV